jgi:hypothetical protein
MKDPQSAKAVASCRLALAGLLFGLLAAPLHAIQFTSGEIKGSFDTTISLGGLYRFDDPSAAYYGTTNAFNGSPGQQTSVNTDDGNLNYGKGWVSQLLKISSDLELRYRNFGFLVRGYYFQDFKADDTRRTPLTEQARDRVEKNFEFLDMYVLGKFDVGATPIDIRFGRQVLSLGESTFIPNGINVINAVDLSKLRAPGAELKEALLPVNMLKASIGLGKVTLEPFWLLEFRRNELEPTGTYFSTSDFASRGGNRVFLGFGTLPDTGTLGSITRENDRDGGNFNQYGLAARFLAEGLFNTEFGLYYARYNSRSPVISARTPTSGVDVAFVQATASSLAAQQLAPAMIAAGFSPATVPGSISTLLGAAFTGVPASALPATLQPFYPAAAAIASGAGRLGLLTAAATGRYFTEYPEGIDMFGASFNTMIGSSGISWQGEVSLKNDVPLQIDDVELLFATLSSLSPTFGSPNNQVGTFVGRYGLEMPGYRRHRVWTAQTTLTKVFGPVLGSQQFTLLGEVGGVWANLPSKDTLRYDGPGTFSSANPAAMAATGFGAIPTTSNSAFADKFSWGYQILGRLEYPNLLAGVNLAPTVAFTHDVRGNTPLPLANYIHGRKSVTVSLEFTFQNAWSLEARYVNFFGAGRFNLLGDRDFAAATVKYSF